MEEETFRNEKRDAVTMLCPPQPLPTHPMPYWQEEKKESVRTKSNKERNLEVEKKFLQRDCKKSYTEGKARGLVSDEE